MPSSTIFCGTCGAQNADTNAFCFACGRSLAGLGATPAAPTLTGRLPAQTLLKKRYRILNTVGRGGMGAVYVAEDIQLGNRLVAVKEMSQNSLYPNQIPDAIESFKREAHLLAGLQHPNLPSIHDYFDESNRWYLVMDFIQGDTLQAYLDHAQDKRLPVEECVKIGIELCNVLDYLHAHKPPIIFRDLKPLNIMRTPGGQIYLIDFGIARHFKQGQAKDTVASGSAGYAPPEQHGRAQTTERSDIYSLGATLHQMLSGHDPTSTPFLFPPLQSLVPTLPPVLAILITQMLDMNESRRPASIREVKQELEQIGKSSQSSLHTPVSNAPSSATPATPLSTSTPNVLSNKQKKRSSKVKNQDRNIQSPVVQAPNALRMRRVAAGSGLFFSVVFIGLGLLVGATSFSESECLRYGAYDCVDYGFSIRLFSLFLAGAALLVILGISLFVLTRIKKQNPGTRAMISPARQNVEQIGLGAGLCFTIYGLLVLLENYLHATNGSYQAGYNILGILTIVIGVLIAFVTRLR
ncbi:MAG: protein kinase [Ktedonobacteraceae bacterium]|nr:protein kinase [Ktedonobacteraceae bacterium]